jgi:hypothetical protein
MPVAARDTLLARLDRAHAPVATVVQAPVALAADP